MSGFDANGWQVFPFDPALADWLTAVKPVALKLAADPDLRKAWLRHGSTWFAGVNVLPNDDVGQIERSGPLRGKAVAASLALYGSLPWDAGQVSVVYPGYPKRDASESEANHRYRRKRDAAHVDGLLPSGPERRRYIREPHAFVLGVPVTDCGSGASPLVIWEGSHEVIRQYLREVLTKHSPQAWSEVDITDAYQAARRQVFSSCRRVEVMAKPGEAYLLHRLALHGVAPWSEGAAAPPEGRCIIYFRPAFPGSVDEWLNND